MALAHYRYFFIEKRYINLLTYLSVSVSIVSVFVAAVRCPGEYTVLHCVPKKHVTLFIWA